MKPEFLQWRIDYPTPDGQQLLGGVMNQFILWHKRDIVLTASSLSIQCLEGVVEKVEVLLPSHDHHLPELPHSSRPPSEHVHEMPQPMPQSSSPPSEHVPEMSQPSLLRKEQGPTSEHVPPEEVHAQEGVCMEPKIWQ